MNTRSKTASKMQMVGRETGQHSSPSNYSFTETPSFVDADEMRNLSMNTSRDFLNRSSSSAHHGPYVKPNSSSASSRYAPYGRKPIQVKATKVQQTEVEVESKLTSTAQRMLEILKKNSTPVVDSNKKVSLITQSIKELKPNLVSPRGPPTSRTPLTFDYKPYNLPVTLPNLKQRSLLEPPPSSLGVYDESERSEHSGGKVRSSKFLRSHERAPKSLLPSHMTPPTQIAKNPSSLLPPLLNSSSKTNSSSKLFSKGGEEVLDSAIDEEDEEEEEEEEEEVFEFSEAEPFEDFYKNKEKNEEEEGEKEEEEDDKERMREELLKDPFWQQVFSFKFKDKGVRRVKKSGKDEEIKEQSGSGEVAGGVQLLKSNLSDKWPCPTCCVPNEKDIENCVCCSEARPAKYNKEKISSQPQISAPPPPLKANTSSDEWKCPTCCVPNKNNIEKCVCCSTDRPSTAKTGSSNTTIPIPSNVDKSKTWQCESCMIFNVIDKDACVCCTEKRPAKYAHLVQNSSQKSKEDEKNEEKKSGLSVDAFKKGFSLPTQSSSPFTFGLGSKVSSAPPPPPATSTTSTSGFTFGFTQPTPSKTEEEKKRKNEKAENSESVEKKSKNKVEEEEGGKFPSLDEKDEEAELAEIEKYKFKPFSGGPLANSSVFTNPNFVPPVVISSSSSQINTTTSESKNEKNETIAKISTTAGSAFASTPISSASAPVFTFGTPISTSFSTSTETTTTSSTITLPQKLPTFTASSSSNDTQKLPTLSTSTSSTFSQPLKLPTIPTPSSGNEGIKLPQVTSSPISSLFGPQTTTSSSFTLPVTTAGQNPPFGSSSIPTTSSFGFSTQNTTSPAQNNEKNGGIGGMFGGFKGFGESSSSGGFTNPNAGLTLSPTTTTSSFGNLGNASTQPLFTKGNETNTSIFGGGTSNSAGSPLKRRAGEGENDGFGAGGKMRIGTSPTPVFNNLGEQTQQQPNKSVFGNPIQIPNTNTTAPFTFGNSGTQSTAGSGFGNFFQTPKPFGDVPDAGSNLFGTPAQPPLFSSTTSAPASQGFTFPQTLAPSQPPQTTSGFSFGGGAPFSFNPPSNTTAPTLNSGFNAVPNFNFGAGGPPNAGPMIFNAPPMGESQGGDGGRRIIRKAARRLNR